MNKVGNFPETRSNRKFCILIGVLSTALWGIYIYIGINSLFNKFILLILRISDIIHKTDMKRKSVAGATQYCCDIDGCNKVFSRSDHLARHKLNHNPETFYSCKWEGCNKQFVRKDVKEKHENRHIIKNEKQKHIQAKRKSQGLSLKSTNSPLENISNTDFNDRNIPEDKSDIMSPNKIRRRLTSFHLNNDEYNYNNGFMGNGVDSQMAKTPDLCGDLEMLNNDSMNYMTEKNLLPTDLTQWLFKDDAFLNNTGELSPNFIFNGVDNYSSSLSMDAFAISPKFPHPNFQTYVDDQIILKLTLLIPSLSNNMDFGAVQIERSLEIYWSIFHVQYPILHRPSFYTPEVHPLLLLSIIMIGAGLSYHTGQDESQIFKDARCLADTIAEPLRWLICSSDEFTSPAKSWIIQSLIILESYEFSCSNRKLHERAYLHHGLKIQLLRRSPLLGGDPLNKSNEDNELTEEQDLWKKWIEIESLKRAALVSFYIDTIRATIFGHEIILFAHQIKLSLPCDDMLWEMSSIDKNNLPPQTETPKFITALTKLLRKEKFEAPSLSRKILLAGLLTINYQMEQKDLQVSFLGWESVKETWKETIYMAIEEWKEAICHGSCRDTKTAFYLPFSNDGTHPLSSRINDTQCKFPIYHIGQALMKINQYDCIIYAGAPSRMNVKTAERDYTAVEQRIKVWANSLAGRLSVVDCYLFLYEMLFAEDNDDMRLFYDPSRDPIFYRPNIVATSLFVVWAFNFSLHGPGSSAYSNNEIQTSSLDASQANLSEDGHCYIKRICETLKKKNNDNKLFNDHKKMYANSLNEIPNKHKLVGLLRLFKDRYINCNSSICREYSDLLENCIQRSLGRKRQY